jgi:hypothetical protein
MADSRTHRIEVDLSGDRRVEFTVARVDDRRTIRIAAANGGVSVAIRLPPGAARAIGAALMLATDPAPGASMAVRTGEG